MRGLWLAAVGLIASTLAPAAWAQETGMSTNSKVMVVPAPGPVQIDGDIGDWDLSAGVWSYNNPTIVAKNSVWTHLMWDDRGVYFLARFADLTPLQNPTMGKDFSMSWRNDCYQARVIFDDGLPDEHQMHINMFYSATENKPYMIVKHGGFRAKPPYDETGPDRPEQLEKWGPGMDPAGGRIAFKKWDNGKGYNCEAFWPWSYCRSGAQALKPGEAFTFGIEALWGWHRLADGIRDDKVNRIFMFRARKGWGLAEISARGRLNISAEQEKLQATRLKAFLDFDTYGAIPLAYTLPKDGGERDVTLAIDDASGKRVRNLIGQYPRQPGANRELWDGLDDNGKPLPAGTYTVTVVDHQPVEVKFVNSVYNAGTPPWPTEEGRKLWGANHGHPTTVATRKDVLLAGFTGVEGATGLLRADANAIIQWTDIGEVVDATLDDKFAYSLSAESWIQLTVLRRFDINTGRNIPFADTARSVQIELPIPYTETSNNSSLAVSGGTVYALLIGSKGSRAMVAVNAQTGAILPEVPTAGNLIAITDRDDTIYGLQADGTVGILGLGQGATPKTLFKAEGLGQPVRLGVSHDGKRFAISDQQTNQVFVFDDTGKRLTAIGAAYEARARIRPAGAFVATNLVAPLGLDFDAQGRLWIAEASSTCRRVTRWTPGASGSYGLDQQYWGGADYGAMAGFAITFDSTRFIAHGVEFALDPQPDPWHRPTQEKPLVFHPELAHERGLVYRLKDHEYAVTTPGYNKPKGFLIAKRNAEGVFVPCVSARFPAREKQDGKTVEVPGRTWVDRNDNGQEEEDEVQTGFKDVAAYWSAGWTRPDLTIITNSQHIYRPAGFSKGGTPLYDFGKPETPANAIRLTPGEQGSTGTIVMDDAGNLSDGIRFCSIAGKQGGYPNRYGRHDAPAAQRGVLIAPFRTNGVVEGVPGVGSITALGGDRGEWFLLSMDGLYLSSILQDSKADITMDETLTGQESFGGFIWRDERGRILVQLGGPSYRIMQVLGLETTRKQVMQVSVTAEQLAAGQKIATARLQAAGGEPKELIIAKVAALPADAADADAAKDQPLLPGAADVLIKQRGDASRWFRVALAHDGKDLAVAWQVADASPWKNGSNRFTHAFIGGDCVDLKLDVPGRGPVRVLAAPLNGKDSAVYFQARASDKSTRSTYMVGNNAANATILDVVRRMDNAVVKSKAGMAGYTVILRVPLAELGLDPAKTASLKGTVGVIYSDPTGTNRVARMYWFDKATDLVSDVPSEARLDANRWGKISLGQ